MRKKLLTGIFVLLSFQLYSQKTVFKPAEWSRPGTPYYGLLSDTRSYQSANFVMFWGDAVGTDPTTANPADRRFNPKSVCDTLEFIYKRFISDLKFCSDDPTTNLGKYKIIIVMLGTFGANGPQGFAFGGSYERTIGAMWVDPAAVKDGGALSHELTHSLQNMISIQENLNPGGGYVGYEPAGFFYEGHANYMRSLVYPNMSVTDIPRWFGTRHFHWSSTRHHYANFRLLYHLGYAMTTRLWKESTRNEHPLVTLRRLKGYTQLQLNDYMYEFVRREPTLDYAIDKNDIPSTAPSSFGVILRNEENRIKNQEPHYQWKKFTILNKVAGSTDRFVIPDDWSPQDYGFNIIPLYPTCTTTTKVVTVKFKGHTEANTAAGWRYGFVTAKADGTISRYSPTYSSNEAEISFDLQATETQMYLVVMGAPTTHTSYVWEPGWPKIKRYPYELKIANAMPEGYQTNFRSTYKTNGRVHTNGGGWITNGTTIASTVYVGPNVIVRGGNYSGNVRIEGTAWVEGATMRDNVVIKDNVVIRRGTYSGNAVVQNNAVLYDCTVSGDVLVKGNALEFGVTFGNAVVIGGDAESGNCSTNGVYLQFPHNNNGRANCDGKGATDASNVDVNTAIILFTDAQMAFGTAPSCGSSTNQPPIVSLTAPVNNSSFCQGMALTLTASASDAGGSISKVDFYDGTLLLGTSTTSPYSYSWTNAGTGTHSITAKATDNEGTTSTSSISSITINGIPSTPAVTTPISYCQNTIATSLSATGTALKWYTVPMNGTSSTTAPTPSTTLTGTTSYYVSQTINSCESARATIAVTVNAVPSMPAVTTPVSYCQNATATALSATGTALKWYTVPVNGTSSSTTPIPSTTSTGTTSYYVSQTTNSCESARATIAVTVNAVPSMPAVTTPVSYCQNATATALSATGTALKWYTVPVNGTSSSTAPTPSTTSTGTTSYYVSQTTNSCESSRATIAVTVNAVPSMPAVTTPVSYCQNATATALTATGTAFKWYTVPVNGTSSSTSPTPSTTSTGTTSYYVSQALSGCESARATIVVTVNVLPSAIITAGGATTFTQGGSVVLSANTGTGLSYKWLNGTSQVGTGVAYTAITSGSYTVEVTNAAGCTRTSSAIIVTVNVNQMPMISITAPANNATFTAPANVGISAIASDADGTVATVDFYNGTTLLGTDPTSPYSFAFNNLSDGVYSITAKATDNNGGVSVSAAITFTVGTQTGIFSTSGINIFNKVYPNPANEQIHIETNIHLENSSFKFLDALGAEVILPVSISGTEAHADVSSIASGVYTLLITQDDFVIRKKIIVIHE